MKTTQQPGSPAEFDKQGHRGCRGLMPENTIQAMTKALDLGVTTLEMDVVVTKDKKIVLSHEPWFSMDITTKPDGSYLGAREERKFNIYWMTYDDVQTFDVGLKPHPRFPQQQKIKVVKPLLTELIDSTDAHAEKTKRPLPFYNIEVKTIPDFDKVFHPEPAEFGDLLMAVIKDKGIGKRTTVQSFDFRVLQYLHRQYPDQRLAVLIEAFDRRSFENQLELLGFTPSTYSPHFSLVTKSMIRKCHDLGMKIIPWTVNEKDKIEKLKEMGVDGIITDYPNLFNELSLQ